MTTDTDFNRPPYNDDYSEDKKFYRMLFRPSVAVQARELTQAQTILQNQIERFGNHILKDGTIITGCSFNFDANYDYIKLPDLQVDGQPTAPGTYANCFVVSSSNLTSVVVGQKSGLESQDPDLNTLYIKYLNTGTGNEKTYTANELLTVYGRYANGTINTGNTVAQIRVANSSYANNVGKGYLFSVSDGIIFQKGFFSKVDAQSIVVESYSQYPDGKVVGFETIEDIVDENIDTSLLDNAQGTTNENAPGAHRLRLTPTLAVYTIGSTPNTFFSLAEFQNGRPTKQRQQTVYSGLAKEFSQRTSEESGDYVVKPFTLSSTDIVGNTTHLNVAVGAGIAYVNGYRVQQHDTGYLPIKKATTVKEKLNQSVSMNYGNYILVKEVLGSFEFNKGSVISLRDTAAGKITAASFTVSAPGNEIGTAKIRSLVYESGTPGTPDATYRAYIFDVKMNAGKNFKNVKSIYYATNVGVADVVQESGASYLYETDFSRLVFGFGTSALKSLRSLTGNNNSQFLYRTYKSDGQFDVSGNLTITLGTDQYHPYTASSTLNDTQEEDIVIIPTASVNSVALTGTVSHTSANVEVVGSGTTFLSQLSSGQWIAVNGQFRRIDYIANSTFLTVTSAFSNSGSGQTIRRHFPANVPVKMAGTGGGSITINGSRQNMTISLGVGLATTANAIVYYNVEKQNAVQVDKTVQKGMRVKIDLSSHSAGTAGPWSLGIPDAYKLVAVYKATTFTNIESVGENVTSNFALYNGQNENFYGLSYVQKASGSTLSLTSADRLLFVFDAFKQDGTGGGKGFFSINSYPVDDASPVLPSDKIRTEQIPLFDSYDLRNVLDFRPIVANTAAYSNTAASATTNPANTETFDTSEKYFPTPNKNFSASYQYYLPRVDRVVLDSFGNLKIVEGVPSENPKAPPPLNNAMTLGVAQIAPYPSLSLAAATAALRYDYAVRFKTMQNRGYTMIDIGAIEARIARLEYYTSLSLLEKNTQDLVIPSEVDPSLNRFKNGILVDPMKDFVIGDLSSSEFSVSIDPNLGCIPKFKQRNLDLIVANTTFANNSELLTLPYSDVEVFKQPYATKYRNAAEQFYKYDGRMTLDPPYDNYYDVKRNPQVVSIDAAAGVLNQVATINALMPLNIQTSTSSTITNTPATPSVVGGGDFGFEDFELNNRTLNFDRIINRRAELAGLALSGSQFTNSGGEQVIETVTTTTRDQLVATTKDTVTQVGDFVTDIRFQPYIRPQFVYFSAYGLRPGARLYAFFDKQSVANYVFPGTPLVFDSTAPKKDRLRINWSTNVLTVDANGRIFGAFQIQPNTFFVGEREFLLLDVDNLNSIDSATCKVSAQFNAYNFAVSSTSLALSTRTAEVSRQTVTETSVTTQRVPIPPISIPRIVDPISQTFMIDPEFCRGQEGIFLTKIDLFFKSKSPTLGVTVELRTTDNGYPTREVLPFSRKHLEASQVSVSDTAANATTFVFDAPVFVKAGYEYAVVILPDGNNPDYLTYVAEIGGQDFLNPNVSVTQDWGIGTLFMSHNNSTWSALQNEDLKFTLYRANFTTLSGNVKFVPDSYEFMTVANVNGAFASSETVFKLTANSTGNVSFTSGNNVITGNGTSFLSQVSAGSDIVLVSGTTYETHKVLSVSNNISLTVKDTIGITNAAAKFMVTPTGEVVSYDADTKELVLKQSSAANTSYLFSANSVVIGETSGANATVSSVNNILVNRLQPLVYRTSVQGTTTSLAADLSTNSYSMTTDRALSFNQTNILDDKEYVIASKSNEISGSLSGAKSFVLTVSGTSAFDTNSPTIDAKIGGIVAYENMVNNNSNNEYLTTGSATSKYVSKQVKLADGQEAEDIRVYLTAFKPAGTDIEVYVKFKNDADSENFSDKYWTKLESTSDVSSDSGNRNSIVEIEYKLPEFPSLVTLSGVVSTQNGNTAIAGSGTLFDSEITVGSSVLVQNGSNYFISSVASSSSNTALVLQSPSPFDFASATISKLKEPQTAWRNPQNSKIVSYINKNGAQFDEYKYFAIKIVLLASGTNLVPRVKDMRAVALTV